MNRRQGDGQAETIVAVAALVGLMLVGCGGGSAGPGTKATAAGLAGGSAGPGGQSVVKFESQPLRRFQPGDTWRYIIRQGKNTQFSTITVLADRVKSPAGKVCSVFQVDATGPAGKPQLAYGAFAQDKDGSEFLYGTSVTSAKSFNWGTPPHDHSIRVQSPLFPQEHWRNAMRRQDGSELDYEALVKNEAPVVVPAGHFKALQIHEASEVHNGKKTASHREDDLWFVPSIGFPIKQMTMYKTGPVTQELVSYKLAGAGSPTPAGKVPSTKK